MSLAQTAAPSASRPTAGVALCVYNGARHLGTQLASIAAQTELPRRLVAVDDGSSDGSWELLQQWAATAPFPVTLERNAANLGVVRNFEKAVRLLLDEVDVVFFSDQDDQWRPGKLAAIVDVFAGDAEVGLVHSDADLVDDAGRPLGARLFDSLLVTADERADVAAGRAWRAYARRNLVTGAACACRSRVLARALPFSPNWVHDEWIAFTAAVVSRVRMLDTPLMAYRLHSANTVGLPIPGLRWWSGRVLHSLLAPQAPEQEKRVVRLRELRAHAERLQAPPEVLACLDQAVAHARHRASLPRNPLRRARAVRAEWASGQYQRWSSGRRSMLRDLFVST